MQMICLSELRKYNTKRTCSLEEELDRPENTPSQNTRYLICNNTTVTTVGYDESPQPREPSVCLLGRLAQ